MQRTVGINDRTPDGLNHVSGTDRLLAGIWKALITSSTNGCYASGTSFAPVINAIALLPKLVAGAFGTVPTCSSGICRLRFRPTFAGNW